MLKEYHYDYLIRWPHGERAAAFLTFDFQGGEDVKPDKNGILNYEMWSQGEYGPHDANCKPGGLQRLDCLAEHVDGVSGLVAAVSGPLGGCASD
jgi:hypothetical protein